MESTRGFLPQLAGGAGELSATGLANVSICEHEALLLEASGGKGIQRA
jgi:hypothetical protein